ASEQFDLMTARNALSLKETTHQRARGALSEQPRTSLALRRGNLRRCREQRRLEAITRVSVRLIHEVAVAVERDLNARVAKLLDIRCRRSVETRVGVKAIARIEPRVFGCWKRPSEPTLRRTQIRRPDQSTSPPWGARTQSFLQIV